MIQQLQEAGHTIDTLAKLLDQAMRSEARAVSYRRRLEKHIAAAVGHTEAGHTVHGDDYEVTAKTNFVRRADHHSICIAADGAGDDVVAEVFPSRPQLNVDAYFALRESAPEAFAIVSRAVCIHEVEPTVTLKRRG